MRALVELVTAVRLHADLQTCLVASCACLLAYLFLWPRRNLPPGPRPWPAVGNVPSLRKCGFVPAILTEMSRRHGDVMTIWLGREPTIVISGYQTIRAALVKRAQVFSNRKAFPIKVDACGDGTSTTTTKGLLFAAYDSDWKQLRKFALMTLRNFGVGKRSLEGKIDEEANILVQEVASQNGQPFDIQIMLQYAVANIICSIVFGERFEYGDQEFLRLISILNSAIEGTPDVTDLLSTLVHPVFRHLHSRSSKQEAGFRMFRALQEYCRAQVQQHRDTFDPNNMRDFIDAFLLEQQKDQEKEIFSDKQLQELLLDLFLAGTETTTTTLRWALLYMVLNPDIQEMIHQEIDSVLGETPPSYALRENMPYTAATITELLRIRPVAPLSVPHAVSEDTILNGYTIPRDAFIWINLWSVHTDPGRFPEPHKFDPNRFLDQGGNFVRNEAIIPFSVGHRSCLGEQLARMELFMLFVSLMQRFTFHLPEGAPKPDMAGHMPGGQIIHIPCPFDVCAVPRN